MPVPEASDSSFLTAEMDFGLNMIRQVPITESLVVSPVSVILALTMIQLGAKGKTKTQINQLISKGSTDMEIVDYYSNLSSQIQHVNNGVNTKIANGFFLNKDFVIENQYRDEIMKKYSALIQSLDFKKEEQAAKIINQFVNKSTAGKITKLVEAKTLKDAFSVVVNAIYFNAEWENKFDNESSTTSKFYSAEEKSKEITFMNDYGVPRLYVENRDVQVLSLPYKDPSFAFNIFLPKQRFNLAAVRKNLDGETIQKLLSQLRTTMVSITIPKMKMENDFKLKEALIAMGITEMFSDNANLTGIARTPPLYVSEANHKAVIEVDEAGTTAAGATSFNIMVRTAMRQPKIFVADHPFIFVLTKDKNPLFIGQFV